MVASSKISVSWVVALADMFFRDARPTDAYMGAAGRHRLAEVAPERMTTEAKSYHRAISLARDSAIYDLYDAGLSRLSPKPLVWLQLPNAAPVGSNHQVLDLGQKYNACVLGASVGVHNPRTGQMDYFALAQQL